MLQKLWRKSDIFKKITKKKISKKKFSSKKIQKSKLVNFRFQLDWTLGFRVRGKNWKFEKAGRTCPQWVLLPACVVCVLMTHPWWLIRRRILEASQTIVAGVNKYSRSLTPKQARPGPVQGLYWPGLNNCFFWNGESQICGESQVSGESQVINLDLHLYKERFGTPAQFPFGSQRSNNSRAPPG